MDNIIIIILVIVGSVISSLIKSVKKKAAERDSQFESTSKSQWPVLQDSMQEISAHAPLQELPEPKVWLPKTRESATTLSSTASVVPTPAIPDEGERVTEDSPITTELGPTETARERLGLTDRDSLRKAVLLSEILAPKF